MYPHERSLVKRLEGKPFALIGVNSDSDREELKRVLVQKQITWRSFWDRGKDGPIAEQWKLDGWPSIWVIDARGVIRYKDVFGPEMDQAVDTLLAEINREN